MAALVVAVPVGRWETSRAATTQRAGIERVRALVGDELFGASLRGRAVIGALECLLYLSGDYEYALELCFDSSGRLVRAIDARGVGDPGLWDIASDPSRTPLQLTPAERHGATDALLLRARVGGATRSIFTLVVACSTEFKTNQFTKATAWQSPESFRSSGKNAITVCDRSVAFVHTGRRQLSAWKLQALDAPLLALQRVAEEQAVIAGQADAELAAGRRVSASTRALAATAAAAVLRTWPGFAPVRRAVGLGD